MIGQRISHYRILERLGSGGMGVVYKARDEKLDRFVAIKFLPPDSEQTEDETSRLLHEARAASALEHKNVCTVHEIDTSPDGRMFIVMAYYEGESLAQRLKKGALAPDDVMRIGSQLAEGLAAAHRRGIVHRDVKPANVMLAPDGQAKIVDFGVAKLTGGTRLTKTGSTLGTFAYMAPEQALGEDVDARADVFSLGTVMYQMLAGHPPFGGVHDAAVLNAVLHDEPEAVDRARDDVPEGLARTVADCLRKEPADRPTADEVLSRLREIRDARPPADEPSPSWSPGSTLRRPAVVVPLIAAAVLVVVWTIRSQARRTDRQWVQQEAIPRITDLLRQGRQSEAFALVKEAEAASPDDPTVRELGLAATVPMTITSEPPGARAYYRPYLDADAPWVDVGVTPIEGVRVPADYLRFRLELDGYRPLEEAASTSIGRFRGELVSDEDAIPGMVPIPSGVYAAQEIESLEVPPFWIDVDEVANADYQSFVDSGGYRKPELWPDALARDFGSWENGMEGLTDATGRPGPATWTVGHYPEGRARHPVGGVSWYEAAAYCAWAGKRLPTLHQWKLATGSQTDIGSKVVLASNFGGDGSVPVGSTQGVGGYGTRDMAGNVAEWVWTEGRDGTRYSLGGGWADPQYIYTDVQARPAADRPAHQGFRCALYDAGPGDPLLAPAADPVYDFANRTVVDDATFQQWETFYQYDPRELDARVESVTPGIQRFDRETVSFTAAYGDDRVVANIFLPRGVAPPYQAVVYSPGQPAYILRSSETLPELSLIEFVPRSGRALVYPIYAGSYERGFDSPSRGPVERRERSIMHVQDLMRTMDYLEQRDDIDADRVAYLGLSAGAEYAACSLAIEKRFRAAVWVGGGYDPTHMQHEQPFEVPWNYAPRVTVPVLMLNGNRDYSIPVESGQVPLFNDLGTASEGKRHVVFDGGHIPGANEIIRETLDWLDRYLGPVETTGTGGSGS